MVTHKKVIHKKCSWDCACWMHYPNEHKKHKNGSWVCVDKYKCIQDVDETPYLGYPGHATHCIRTSNY